MILKSITVRDFGVFEGEQCVNLTPSAGKGVKKPIVLFLGNNGTGKTTLFEAFTLCVYGQYFRGHKIKRPEYEAHLKRRMHESPDGIKRKSASVKVVLSYSERGNETTLELVRSWATTSRGRILENSELITLENGSQGHRIANPNQFILNLFPLGVSQFLFFDGERIKTFAESTEPNLLLKDGFFALAGIDVVNRSWRDLALYLFQLKSSVQGKSQSKWEELANEIKLLTAKREECRERVESLSHGIGTAQAKVMEEEQRLAREGSDYAESRNSLLRTEMSLQHEIEDIHRQISRLCDGVLPFCLAPSLVHQAITNLLREKDYLRSSIASDAARKITESVTKKIRDGSLLDGIVDGKRAESVAERLIAAVEEFSSVSDRNDGLLHNISEKSIENVIRTLRTSEKEALNQIQTELTRYRAVFQALAETRQSISRIPPNGTLAPIVERLHESISQLAKAESERMQLLEELRIIDQNITSNQRAQERELEEIGRDSKQELKIHYAEKALKGLRTFETSLTEVRVRKLEGYLLEIYNGFRSDGKKFQEIHINSDDFTAEIRTMSGARTSSSSLSAGEKQLYAIAMLGAISKSTNLGFPFLIDTPLARLDRKHRRSVSSHFLPSVSDQVVIFATNTEFTRSIRETLEPYLSREFRIRFDGTSGSSTIVPINGGSG